MSKSKPNAASSSTILTRFTLPYLPAEQVCVAGSFNDWQPARLQLADAQGSRWQLEIALPAGTYEYLFVVDGRWLTDPNNPNTVPNPFGGVNSVVKVEADPPRRGRRTPKANT